jgi:hypothetical protein
MFKSGHVPCFLNTFAGHGDDNEAKELKMVFHVAPIPYELALEVSPHLADRLFRQDPEEGWQPVKEMPKASFATIQVPMQNITFHALPEGMIDDTHGVLVEGCAVSNLRAARANVDGLDFRLEFDVVVPMDSITMDLVERFYKSTCYLSTEAIQREMEYPEKENDTERSLQEAADGDGEPKKRGRRKKQDKPTDDEVMEEAMS